MESVLDSNLNCLISPLSLVLVTLTGSTFIKLTVILSFYMDFFTF